MMTAIEQFLMFACKNEAKVDLRTRSGFMFEKVGVSHIQDGAAELKQVENRVVRLYVLAIDQIEWAVRSRVQR